MLNIREIASRLLNELYRELDAQPELARKLADVGVKGNKLYLAAIADRIPDSFVTDHVLPNVTGVSATRDIWRQWSPDHGRNMLFVLPADETLKLNKLVRIGYDNPKKLLANNCETVRRIMPINNFVRNVFDRVVRKANLSGDPIAVGNMAGSIMLAAERDGNLENDARLPTKMDKASFGKITAKGIDLSSVERFANLYHQAAKGLGSYGRDVGKFFAPQSRSKWLPLLNDAIVAQASVYADEAEWRNLGDKLIIPKGTQVLYAVDPKYINNTPRPLGWMDYELQSIEEYKKTVEMFKRAGIKLTVVDSRKTIDSMHAAQARKRMQT